MSMTAIMNAQARARPTLNWRVDFSGPRTAGCAGSATVGGVVTVAMSPPLVQVGRAGPGDPVLDGGDDHEHDEQRHRHRRGVAELEPAEGDVVDVELQDT